MACPCNMNASPTITLAPPARKTKYHKRVKKEVSDSCCPRMPQNVGWERIKREPPVTKFNIQGLGEWWHTNDFRTSEGRVRLYEEANSFSVQGQPKGLGLVEATPGFSQEYLVFDGSQFYLVSPTSSESVSVSGLSTVGVVDVLRMPNCEKISRYLVVYDDGTLVKALLTETTLVEQQTLTTGVDDVVGATLSYRCLTPNQRYTFQLIDGDRKTTSWALWDVDDTLSIVDGSSTTGFLDVDEGELRFATDQQLLNMVVANTDALGETCISLFEPTLSNKFAIQYYTLNLPSPIIHMEANNKVIDLILENLEWVRIEDGNVEWYR